MTLIYANIHMASVLSQHYPPFVDDSYVGIIQIRYRVVHSCTSQPLSAPLVLYLIILAGLQSLQVRIYHVLTGKSMQNRSS